MLVRLDHSRLSFTKKYLLLGLKKDRFVVRENNPVEMDCHGKLENITRVRWEFTSTQEIRSEIIYDSQSNQKLRPGFEVSCQPHQTFISKCNLKLVYARKEDSGIYICSIREGNEAMLDSNLLKTISEIELVIRSNINCSDSKYILVHRNRK